MKKQVITRGLLGIPLGIALGYVITIIISAILAQGYYYPCVPGFAETVGSEINAVIIQTVLSGILGASFAMASVIWEVENWSIAKQSGIYFAIVSVVMLPTAYITNWMEHSLAGFLLYFGIFAAIFLIVWAIQYCVWKSKIKKMNESVRNDADVQ